MNSGVHCRNCSCEPPLRILKESGVDSELFHEIYERLSTLTDDPRASYKWSGITIEVKKAGGRD